ncbi:MAG: ATP-binding cassette domain-containing protein [Defluviitaleaceae bacterium]|nr:ATP-binding cassette domain-containing protein [Defluviitaleaceae bacterium]
MNEDIIRIQNASDGKLLKSIYISAYRSETIGIIFNNTQECQSLFDILSGKEKFSDGRIYHNETRVTAVQAQTIYKKNCEVIEGAGHLIEHMTIAENICVVGSKKMGFFISSKKCEKKTQLIFDKFNIKLPVKQLIIKLSPYQKIIVALIKAYVSEKTIVLLKDMTSLLNRNEIENVMHLISDLKKQGMSYVFFETYEGILFRYTDTLSIVKNGKTVGIFKSEELSKQKIYSMISENIISEDMHSENMHSENFTSPKEGKVVLEFDRVCTDFLDNVSLKVRQGEIVKLFLDYTSCNHIVDLLKGEIKTNRGNLFLPKGIGFIEENPFSSMLIYEMSVLDNLCLSLSKKVVGIWAKPKYRKSIIATVGNIIGTENIYKPLAQLSLVELQKIVYCKWYLYAPGLVVCMRPFSAVDVQTREVTGQMIRLLASRGIAVLIITSSVSEIELITGDTYFIQNGKLPDENKTSKDNSPKSKV